MSTSRAAGKRGVPAMMKLIEGKRRRASALCAAVPQGRQAHHRADRGISCSTSGRGLNLAPRDEAGRLWAHQLQLTIADLVVRIHDTHHPVSGWLYFEEQTPGGAAAHQGFLALPACRNMLGYFERVLQKNGGRYSVGRRLSYVDLSLFQIVEGLRYAFPKRMKRFEKKDAGARSRCTTAWRNGRASKPISHRSGAFRSASGASIAISRSSTGEGRARSSARVQPHEPTDAAFAPISNRQAAALSFTQTGQ